MDGIREGRRRICTSDRPRTYLIQSNTARATNSSTTPILRLWISQCADGDTTRAEDTSQQIYVTNDWDDNKYPIPDPCDASPARSDSTKLYRPNGRAIRQRVDCIDPEQRVRCSSLTTFQPLHVAVPAASHGVEDTTKTAVVERPDRSCGDTECAFGCQVQRQEWVVW